MAKRRNKEFERQLSRLTKTISKLSPTQVLFGCLFFFISGMWFNSYPLTHPVNVTLLIVYLFDFFLLGAIGIINFKETV